MSYLPPYLLHDKPFVCTHCFALIFDRDAHDQWHIEALQAVNTCPEATS